MKQKIKFKRKSLTLAQKQEISGYLFISPFILGFLVLFLMPLIQSISYSVSELKMGIDGFELVPVQWANYEKALFIDPDFIRTLVESVGQMFFDVPIILIFSFFAATLLNQNFKGRGIVRVIFFLPVIMVSGVIGSTNTAAMIREGMQMESEQSAIMMSTALADFLLQMEMSPQFTMYIMKAVDGISDVVVQSGVQILVFLAGLQSIPSSLYESASIEGATAWESFWKITFPMIGSLILVNTVYTIVNSFTSSKNEVIRMIKNVISQNIDYGLASAMSWIYFIVIALIVSIAMVCISKRVFYHE
ncbi:MAG: sugar ABC transporter permease [Candidatus Niameybacter stercoravium]|nr:sugar ABC transporter permease [Candidatus Niameybacter stercoravium]